MHHFYTKLTYQKPMLRQIESWVQNGPITKNGVLPVTTLYFWKFRFSLRTSYNELIWCTNDPNAHICTFGKRWNFIWRYFFPVSILKRENFYHLIVRNWRSHWLIKSSFGKIAANPSISITGTIHVRNTYLAAANIKSTQMC